MPAKIIVKDLPGADPEDPRILTRITREIDGVDVELWEDQGGVIYQYSLDEPTLPPNAGEYLGATDGKFIQP